jgi:hypothetical protein
VRLTSVGMDRGVGGVVGRAVGGVCGSGWVRKSSRRSVWEWVGDLGGKDAARGMAMGGGGGGGVGVLGSGFRHRHVEKEGGKVKQG